MRDSLAHIDIFDHEQSTFEKPVNTPTIPEESTVDLPTPEESPLKTRKHKEVIREQVEYETRGRTPEPSPSSKK